MVVLAVSILNTAGKILLSRQFVDMTRIRIEGLLAAFPKLLGSNKEHTYVETENVRYVYHPLESMYLLCITNKGSNIIEDLATLQMLSKVVPDICGSLTEDAVLRNGFDLVFAFDEVLTGGGYKVDLSMTELRANLTMDSHEEKLHQMIIESKRQEAHDNMILQAGIIKEQKREGNVGGKYSGMGSSGVGDSMGSVGGGGSMSAMSYITGESGAGSSSHGGYAHESAGSGAGDSSFGASSPSYVEPVRAQPTKGLSLGGPSKNNNFLKAMAVEDNVSTSFYQKPAATEARGAAVPVAAAPRGPVGDIEISCVETVTVLATRDSDLEKMDVRGTMTLTAHSDRAALATIKFARRDLPGLALQPNPILDRKALAQNIVRPRAPTKPFPVGVPAGVIKWRFSSDDKAHMPISINVWPEASGRSTTVSIEYNLENLDMSLHDVCITIPLGSSAAPEVLHVDGVSRHVAKTESIEWRHELIDGNNPSGQLEFEVAGTDEDVFFPCTVHFSSNFNFADFKFEAAVDAEKSALKVVSENAMNIAEYTVS